MVRGKPSNRLDRGVDILTLSLRDRFLIMFMLINTMGAGRKLVPCSQGECSYPQAGKKGKWLFGNNPMLFQMCVLGLPCKVEIRFESSASHGLGLLDPFATQSNKSNITMINLDV